MSTPNLDYIAEDLRPLAVKTAGLAPNPDNANEHTDDSVAQIARSLALYGQRKPIVVNRADNVIEAGSGTLMAAERLGWEYIAAVFVDDDQATATGYAIADNRTAELSTWVFDTLKRHLEDGFEDPTEVPGVDETFWLEVREQAKLAAEVRDQLRGESKSDRQLGDRDKLVAPVIAVEDLTAVELALRATGYQNRGEALVEVCAYYLLNNAKGQQHLSAKGDPETRDAREASGSGRDGDTRRPGPDLVSLLSRAD
ncbi:MAG: ParB N-terminal domain-containing protein [Thiohalospira sp.]